MSEGNSWFRENMKIKPETKGEDTQDPEETPREVVIKPGLEMTLREGLEQLFQKEKE